MSEKGFRVEEVKGGWVLDWHDRRRDPDAAYRASSWPRPALLPTSGREIYTTKKALEKRLRELI